MVSTVMQFVQLSSAEAAVERFIETLWLPYQRTLERIVERHSLIEDTGLLDAELDYRQDRLCEADYELLVALESAEPVDSITSTDAVLTGFISTERADSPEIFDQPAQLRVGDFFVTEDYRGTGLADELLAQAVERARREDCAELTLEVDVDNDRARAYYDSLGFSTIRQTRAVSVEECADRLG